ncbi:hypothetical protein [Sinorhizobium meliloti]|uniref:hypothetical protein n=1 Tax=Rhizobium meliloti TaxID=382 RepID=UPI0010729688|nr:hypothetical protein [Sinorhizobium meliloti]MQW30000.1 hypothetical protein [Sinorhizobium meliloti]
MPSQPKFLTMEEHRVQSLKQIEHIVEELEKDDEHAVFLRAAVVALISYYRFRKAVNQRQNTNADFFDIWGEALERQRENLASSKAYWEGQIKAESDPDFKAEREAEIAEMQCIVRKIWVEFDAIKTEAETSANPAE